MGREENGGGDDELCELAKTWNFILDGRGFYQEVYKNGMIRFCCYYYFDTIFYFLIQTKFFIFLGFQDSIFL